MFRATFRFVAAVILLVMQVQEIQNMRALRTAKSQKGKAKLPFGNFLFEQNRVWRDRIYWACERRRDVQCPIRMFTTAECTVLHEPTKKHNHLAETP